MTIRAFESHETPEQVYGRLTESVHHTGYGFERACEQLKWLLRQDRWKAIPPGYEDIDKFLASIDLTELRLARDERKDLVQQLAAIRAGQRATARLLGVGEQTVARDLGKLRGAPNGAADSKDLREVIAEHDKTLITDAPSGATPTPYYSEAGITIYHGDCRAILPTLERGLMVTDPPYNIGYHYNEYGDALDDVEYWAFLQSVLRMPLVIIHYPESICRLAMVLRRVPEKVVAWVYQAGTPKQWRGIAWFGTSPDLSLVRQPYRNPDDKRVRARMALSGGAALYDWWLIEQVKNVSAEKQAHPCQIPVAVMQRALQVTPFDGPVIDPFCGAGSTLVAAQIVGRRAIGIEISEEYCEIAANRLRAHGG